MNAHNCLLMRVGPGWRIGVLRLTDGSTAVTLVLSHYVVDGLGLAIAVTDAVLGNIRDFGYPPPGSRTRRRAVVQDARPTAQDAREAGRALVAAAKLARKQAHARQDIARSPAPRDLSPSVAATAMTLSWCRLSGSNSMGIIGTPVLRLLALRVAR